MAEGATFHGVDLGWMQAQWRDCADKAAQLAIFRDMTGGKATIQQILEAVGEPDYMGPEIVELKSGRFAPEEDETIIRMFRAGKTCGEIGAALNRKSVAITNRIFILRQKGVRIERETADAEPVKAEATETDLTASFSQIDAELRRLLTREAELGQSLEEVRGEIGKIRRTLSVMVELARSGGDHA